MDLLSLNFLNKIQTSNKVKNNTTNNFVYFKGETKPDTFESSQDKDLEEALNYLNKKKSINATRRNNTSRQTENLISLIKKYPQIAFLYNPKYSKEEKEEKITQLDNMLISKHDSKCELSKELKDCIEYACSEIKAPYSDKKYFILFSEIQDIVNNKDESKVCIKDNFNENPLYQLIPDTEINEIKGEKEKPVYILKFNSDTAKEIYENWKKGKIKFYEDFKEEDLSALPITYMQYETENGTVVDNHLFIDTENPDNKKVLKSSSDYKNFLRTLPFERSEIIRDGKPFSYIDMSIPKNKELLDSTSSMVPKKSKYYINPSELFDTGYHFSKLIPVKTLINDGFGTAEQLAELVKNREIKLVKEKIDDKDILKIEVSDKSIGLLQELKDNNPNICKFNDCAKQLGITQTTLRNAVYEGEFEIIQYVIFPNETDTIYVNIDTPKNKEFIQKVQFEQELKKRQLEQKREEQRELNKEKRIARQNDDYHKKLLGARMSLVWSFMPETRAIASDLAKGDGYLAKLFEKEDDPDQELTPKEQVIINSYRKKVWQKAGTTELKKAYKYADKIMQIYKEQGIEALDIDLESRKILEEYGFN